MVPIIIIFILFNITYSTSLGQPEGLQRQVNQDSTNGNVKNVDTNSSKITVPKVLKNREGNDAAAGGNTGDTVSAVIDSGKDAFSTNNDPRDAQKTINEINAPLIQNQKNSNYNESDGQIPNTEQQQTDKNSNMKEPSDHSKSTKTQTSSKGNGSLNKVSVNKSSTLHPIKIHQKEDVLQSGALLRGFYVFVGLSVIIMVYFVFRSYRLKRASHPSTTVYKYGVTARRSDMEMRPLELEDEEDDTLFEIGNMRTIR